MRQLTLRTPDALLERVRRAAHERDMSINEYVSRVLDAATDPDLATTDAERLRQRLSAAGLLVTRHAPAPQRPSESVIAAARQAAGRGTPLSTLVSEGRE